MNARWMPWKKARRRAPGIPEPCVRPIPRPPTCTVPMRQQGIVAAVDVGDIEDVVMNGDRKEKNMNKKLKLAAAALAVAMAWAAKAEAASTADLTVTVTVQTLSIAASFRDAAGTTYAMGNVAAGSSNLVGDPVTITNTGNVTQTYNLRIPSEPNGTWASVVAAPGGEQYQMSGVFRATTGAAPVGGDYVDNSDDYSVSQVRTADGTNVLAVNGDSGGAGKLGYQMAVNSNIYLWLRFKAPTSTVITTQQSIVTRITAATP